MRTKYELSIKVQIINETIIAEFISMGYNL